MLNSFFALFFLYSIPVQLNAQNIPEIDFSKSPPDDLTFFLEANREMVPFFPTLFPFDSQFYISSKFGNREHPITGAQQFHSGVDFSCPNGTRVFSPANGRVIKVVHNDKVIGNSVTISHLGGWETSYSHLRSISVTADQILQRFDTIGHTGNSGLVTGNHLHYSIYLYKKPLDPLPFCYIHKYLIEN